MLLGIYTRATPLTSTGLGHRSASGWESEGPEAGGSAHKGASTGREGETAAQAAARAEFKRDTAGEWFFR